MPFRNKHSKSLVVNNHDIKVHVHEKALARRKEMVSQFPPSNALGKQNVFIQGIAQTTTSGNFDPQLALRV